MTQDAAHKRVLLLNIPVVHVCVDRHSRSSADQQLRAQGSAHRTYYCCKFSIVNVETYSCHVVPVAPVAQRYHVTSDTLGREFDPGKRDFSH